MEAIRRQASKLREQVAKQQQTLMKQLGHFDAEAIMTDEELKCHQQLQNLYRSTRKCNQFQKDIVRGCQGYIYVGSKQTAKLSKLAENCCKYGTKEQCPTSPLAEVAFQVGTSHYLVEKEREILLRILSDKVFEPLRALVGDFQLEDARLLVRQYESLWQEVETQTIEVARQKWRTRDGATGENSLKLEIEEGKLNDLKSRLMACGKEANAAMSSIESQQQKRSADYLLAMVEAERTFSQNVLMILDNLLEELTTSSEIVAAQSDPNIAEVDRYHNSPECCGQGSEDEFHPYFIARAIHPYDAIEEGELSLTVDDYVVVYQVSKDWYKGESKGEVGWFPSAYVEIPQ